MSTTATATATRPTTRAKSRSIDPHKLDGAERRAWEEQDLATPGLRGSRVSVLRALHGEWAWGKPWCYPSDELIASKCGLSEATVSRCLHDLKAQGIIRIVHRGRRRLIIFPGHPHAAAYLAGLGIADGPAADPIPADRPDPPTTEPAAEAERIARVFDRAVCHFDRPAPAACMDTRADGRPPQTEGRVPQFDGDVPQFEGRSVLVKPGIEARNEPRPASTPACARASGAGSGGSKISGSNEPTTRGGHRGPIPLSSLDWRAFARAQGITPPPPESAGPARRIGEAARRRDERFAAERAAMGPEERAREIAAALGEAPSPAPEPPGPAPAREAAAPVDREAATLEVLSRLGPGATRGEVLAATARLTCLFGDLKSRAYYRGVVNEVARGELAAGVLGTAVRAALGPDVERPGAAFAAAVKRCKAAAARREQERGKPRG